MLAQYFLVALLVLACAAYATWTLMPATLRRRGAAALAPLPWPRAAARWLAGQAAPAAGCGCDGCDRSALAVPKTSAGAPITFHRRPPKRG
jgi:hypothetical protein